VLSRLQWIALARRRELPANAVHHHGLKGKFSRNKLPGVAVHVEPTDGEIKVRGCMAVPVEACSA
jgi:hypothetical protein